MYIIFPERKRKYYCNKSFKAKAKSFLLAEEILYQDSVEKRAVRRYAKMRLEAPPVIPLFYKIRTEAEGIRWISGSDKKI